MLDDLGGFFRIRYADGVRYIDYLEENQNTNSQVIKLGRNLMDLTKNVDLSEIATAIIPLGERLEESPIEGLEARLTIESVNDGRDYVFSQEAVNNYGWIYKTVTYDNVTTPSALKEKGQKYLTDEQYKNMVIEATAIDLHLIDNEIEGFKLSDNIRVLSEPHGLDRFFRLTQMKLNLNNPEKDTITLGKASNTSLSAKTASITEEFKKEMERIASPSSIIKQAVDNATQLITNAMGGYVYKTNNELYIMDTNNPKTAQKVWRWNINGLGYSSTGINGQYGLAMTMDGNIVADFIASGTMYADRIKGGTLTLGGQNNTNGSVTVLNENGNTIGTFNKDGIVIEKGRISGADIHSYGLDISGESVEARIEDGKMKGIKNGQEIGTINFSSYYLSNGVKYPQITLDTDKRFAIVTPYMHIGKGDKTSGGLLSVSQCSDTTVTVVTSVSYASGQVFATTKKLKFINGLLVTG